ncbi:MAG: STAS domain-containing protein [Blastocatellia bacterium]
MQIRESRLGRITILHIQGQAILSAAPERLSQCVRDHLEAGDRLFVLNLAECSKMDSTGLGELVKAQRLIADCEGVLKFARVPPALRSLFIVTNLTELIESFDTEQAAINSFGA